MGDHKPSHLIELTTEIVSAFVAKNPVPSAGLPELIRSVHETLSDISHGTPGPSPRPKPVVPVNKSVTPDYLICLEDGRKLKMLKRYLRSRYAMTPEEYRARWNLPNDYPMVAPNYAKRRSDFAKEIGLGRKAAG
ncbi:MAG: MucR family transcriptional regulator [Pseudomonadota bacterium]